MRMTQKVKQSVLACSPVHVQNGDEQLQIMQILSSYEVFLMLSGSQVSVDGCLSILNGITKSKHANFFGRNQNQAFKVLYEAEVTSLELLGILVGGCHTAEPFMHMVSDDLLGTIKRLLVPRMVQSS